MVNCAKIRCHPDTQGMIEALEAQDLCAISKRLYNVFEDIIPARNKTEINCIKHTLIQHGAEGAAMSGTGPTVFGLFSKLDCAQRAHDALSETYKQVFLTQRYV